MNSYKILEASLPFFVRLNRALGWSIVRLRLTLFT